MMLKEIPKRNLTLITWLCCAGLLLGGISASADEIYLKDGRVIVGEITSTPDADTVNVRVIVTGIVAVQHFSRDQIRSIKHGVSAEQEAIIALSKNYDSLLARSDSTAAEWWALTRKFQDRGATAMARDSAAQTVARERNHEEARRLLGMTRYRGVWMRAHEVAAARGEVFFRGSWVSWDVQQQTLEDEARRKEEAIAERKERSEQRRLARIAAAEAAASSASLYPETYVSGYYRSPYYNAYGTTGVYCGFGGYPIQPIYRPYLPFGGIGYPLTCNTGGGIAWHLGASGGGSNNAWSLNWNGASNYSSSTR
jgi:hypothetical protein